MSVQLALLPNGRLRAFSTFLKLNGAAYSRSRHYKLESDDYDALKTDIERREQSLGETTARTLDAEQLRQRVGAVDAAMRGGARARQLGDERRAGADRHGRRWRDRALVRIAALSPLPGEPLLCGGSWSTGGKQPRGTNAVPSRSFIEALSRRFVVLLVNEYLSSQQCPQVNKQSTTRTHRT